MNSLSASRSFPSAYLTYSAMAAVVDHPVAIRNIALVQPVRCCKMSAMRMEEKARNNAYLAFVAVN